MDEEKEFQAEMAVERLSMDVLEALSIAMVERGVSRSDLAEMAGKTRSAVTQLLQGRTGITIERLARYLHAMDYGLQVSLVDRLHGNRVMSLRNYESDAECASKVINMTQTQAWDRRWHAVTAEESMAHAWS